MSQNTRSSLPGLPDAQAGQRNPRLDDLLENPEQAGSLSWDTAALLLVQCAALQSMLAACLLRARADHGRGNQARLVGGSAPPGTEVDNVGDREYLSIGELAERIPYTEGSIRNLMSQGRLHLGQHYVKPNGRVMFRWSAVRDWLEQQSSG
jgi:hypothetical protein